MDMKTQGWHEETRDEESALPLYYRLFLKLRDAIFSGEFAEGSTLPGEHALCAEYAVSRVTVRRALNELVSRGLISREAGRGTKVRTRLAFSPIVANIDGLLERSSILGQTTEAEVLEFAEVQAPADVAKVLKLRGGKVTLSVLLRHLEGEPFMHFTSWVPTTLGRRFNRKDLVSNSALSLLDHNTLAIKKIQQTIAAEPASRSVAAHLKVNAGMPLLRVERVVLDADDKPMEWSVAVYRHDRHQYRLNLVAPNSPNNNAVLKRPAKRTTK